VWSNIPTFTRTTTLSPEQQRIAGQQNAASFNLAHLGNRLSGTLGKQLTGNFKIDNPTVEKRLFDLGRKRLDPMFEQQQKALDAKLLNQGIGLGGEQWKAAQTQQGQNQNDAYNQLLLSGRGQATQELMAQDNQRINQISALLNGGQVSQPNFMGANMPTIPTTDVGGLINENYNQRANIAAQKNAALGSTVGGLFKLGSSFLYSDIRLKQDIRRVGMTNEGLPIYVYRYKDGGPMHMGVMAQDVEKVRPEAVKEFGGFKAVDYGQVH
jgi:hypothetical protein